MEVMDNSNSNCNHVVKQHGPPPAVVTPITAIAEAFENLAIHLREDPHLRLDVFCQACSLVSVLFNCLGFAFKFAELEYDAKLQGLMEASKTCETLKDVLDFDVANDTVRTSGSYSRNLRRVRQGLDLIKAIFEQLLINDDSSLKDVASTAYGQACAPFHTWAVRTAVYAGMYTLPTREQLLFRLNETEQSAEKKMRRYINASIPVIEYIDTLYISQNIKLDW